MSDAETPESTETPHKPGDVVNGHILTSANTWVPLAVAPVAAGLAPTGPAVAKKWFLKKRFLIPGIVVLVLILSVAFTPKKSTLVDAADSAPLATAQPTTKSTPKPAVEVAVPDVSTQTAADATAVLTGLGFKVPAVDDPSALVTATNPAAGTKAVEGSTVKLTVAVKPALSLEQKNAVGKAQDYLAFQAFSRSGLIGQLEYEGYPTDVATFATDYIGADWNAQAVAKAQDYLSFQSFSREGLYDQLVYEGFSDAEANAGLAGVGY